MLKARVRASGCMMPSDSSRVSIGWRRGAQRVVWTGVVRPCRMALMEDRRLPCSVLGPVERWAFF